jgi:hypothetical protein
VINNYLWPPSGSSEEWSDCWSWSKLWLDLPEDIVNFPINLCNKDGGLWKIWEKYVVFLRTKEICDENLKTINCKEYAQGFNFWLKRLNDNGNTNSQNESSVSKY